MESNTTIVTGIWDIGRSKLHPEWSRTFDHYLNHLEAILKIPNNLIIFIPKQYRSFVEFRRQSSNTLIIERELEWFKSNEEIYNNIQKIRTNPLWYDQTGWLSNSTQAKLEMYNPLVMSKMFLLNDACLLDPFNSTHLLWVDGGLSNTVSGGYFWHDKVFNKIDKYFDKFSFVCFPYNGKLEIHGFEYKEICKQAGKEVNRVARGGIFGGPKKEISKINSLYYSLLYNTLYNGYMGTEESLFTILTYTHPELFNIFDIKEDGLLWLFFENLKNDSLKKISNKTSLYVISYNSPPQFNQLCKSFDEYDRDFLFKPKKFLLNNSTDKTTDEQYKKICIDFDFEEIKKDNIGICGGRQFIAEHFDQSGYDNYFFFEDDMMFCGINTPYCKNGFIRWVEQLYQKSINIINEENLDFLKFNFTEFFGNNSDQWAWYNVPEPMKSEIWGSRSTPPKTQFHEIKNYDRLSYALGEIYYCNWPQIMSRKGNKKIFLDTKWANPYEQTWMSHTYQLTKKGEIKAGLLLATPTEHNRFDHYEGERKES